MIKRILKMIKTFFRERRMVKNIIQGFKREEFKPYLQFIVDAKTKEISSAEALSRRESKKNGIILPGKYIGVMEKTD